MTIPPAGTPVGLEIAPKDTARGAACYTAVFNWSFAPSSLGLPAEKLLTFTVPGGVFPIGGAIRRVEAEELAAVKGVTKLYLYVDDITAAQQACAPKAIEKYGGKLVTDVIPEGDKGLFQSYQDSEGNGHAIYTYVK